MFVFARSLVKGKGRQSMTSNRKHVGLSTSQHVNIAPPMSTHAPRRYGMRSVRLGLCHMVVASSFAALGCSSEDIVCVADAEGLCVTPQSDSEAPLALSERLAAIETPLSEGSSGPEVLAVHDYLTEYGYFPSESLAQRYRAWRPIIDAAPADPEVYDEHTAGAVRELQARSGLAETGAIDHATIELLQQGRCGVPEGLPVPDASLKYDAFNGNGVWDDPADVTWRVTNGMTGITAAQATTAIAPAFDAWQAATSITFRNITAGTADIQISFGASGGLASSFQPDDGGNDLGGDITIGNGVAWSIDGTPANNETDLQTVLLHEIGHAIGLRHSSFLAATMEPFTGAGAAGMDRILDVDDTVGISSRYDAFVGVTGQAHDIGVGGDGTDGDTAPDVWIIGNTPSSGGFVVQKWNGSSFVSVADGGSGERIAVTPNGRPWVVTDSGTIWERATSSTASATWTQRAGCATDIGIGGTGASGAVWVLGCSALNGGFSPHQWNGTTFVQDVNAGAAAVRIAVDSAGIPWAVNSNNEIFRRTTASATTGTWTQIAGGATDIGIGPANYPWVLGATATGSGFRIYVWNDQRASVGGSPPPNDVAGQWLQRPGSATSISVGFDGEPWVSANNLTIHHPER
jgi:hypothetical protein